MKRRHNAPASTKPVEPDPAWDAIIREAAQIALSLPPLIATPEAHRTPEQSLVEGMQKRWDFVLYCITDRFPLPVSRNDMHAILRCEGAYGHERMCSAWWSGLGMYRLRILKPDLLNTSAFDLMASGVLSRDAAATFDQQESPIEIQRRLDARKELSDLLDKMRKIAEAS